MDAEEFAKGYERDPRDFGRLTGRAWRTARTTLVEPSLIWSHFFSHIIDEYLPGGDLHINDTARQISLYTGDATRHMIRNVIEATEEAAVYRPSLGRDLSRMNFHTMNQEMGPAWLHLIDPETYDPLSHRYLAAIQARLATHALRLVEARRTFYDRLMVAAPETPIATLKNDRLFAGRITEIDAIIAMLQVVKDEVDTGSEGLVVLPAPAKYESFLGKAADLLIFDTDAWQAHGIQVKTRLRDTSKYDAQYVSFIDGVGDLGNYKEKVHHDGSTTIQPIPGLISADYILNSEDVGRFSAFSRMPEFQGSFGAIYHARETARSMQGHMDYTDRVNRAAEAIGPRILAALHNNGPEDTEEPDELPGS